MTEHDADAVVERLATAWHESRLHSSSEAGVEHVLRALKPGDRLRSGLVVVPEEPTDSQHDAARGWSYGKYGKPIGKDASDGCYRAMIAAASGDT